MERYVRRDILLNDNQIKKIENAKVAIFGVGGVGGYTLEALARMGISDFIICDGDVFSESNLNRQILSNESNIGLSKALVAKDRVLSINSNAKIIVYPLFVNKDTIKDMDLSNRFIVDAIDDVQGKLELIKYANNNGNKIVSMMGAGNRIHADFIASDINKTENDPLARKMRYELRKLGISKLKVIYTKSSKENNDSSVIGSLSYVVGQAGLVLAEEVIKEILE